MRIDIGRNRHTITGFRLENTWEFTTVTLHTIYAARAYIPRSFGAFAAFSPLESGDAGAVEATGEAPLLTLPLPVAVLVLVVVGAASLLGTEGIVVAFAVVLVVVFVALTTLPVVAVFASVFLMLLTLTLDLDIDFLIASFP